MVPGGKDPAMTEKMHQKIHDFVRKDFTPHFGELAGRFGTNRLWRRARQAGSELWLDTGSITSVSRLWTDEFTALTTNNSLLNKEIQAGAYDALVPEAVKLLADAKLTEHQRTLELAFILNAYHGLRLVEQFDAYVSVEEHTDLAHDVDAAVACAKRYHAICPQRFIVKIPLTPAGLLATRRLAAQGVPVNHTLGFSARQNYVAARLARPQFVNVFMGRLNAFVADNDLGDGRLVGERATMASQRLVRQLSQAGRTPARQIAASIRNGRQVRDSLGVDVLTIPPSSAEDFLHPGFEDDELIDRTGVDFQPTFAHGVDPATARLETLWDVDEKLIACLDALEAEDLDSMGPGDLVAFFASRGCGDLLVRWSDKQIAASAAEGKIPKLHNWRAALAEKSIGLDSLMNLAGLLSFAADQNAMDNRVAGFL